MKKTNILPYPEYKNIHSWEIYHNQLMIEYRQCIDEGRDMESFRQLFEAVEKMPDCPHKIEIADALYRITFDVSVRKGYRYIEPSDLETIKKCRKIVDIPIKKFTEEELYDKVKGAWYGRICGCLLGKPFEGIRSKDLNFVLKNTDNYPLKRYMNQYELTDDILKQVTYKFPVRIFPDNIENAPADDDTNYTVMASNIIDKYGKDFTPENVAHTWLVSQLKDFYCTAERVAYINIIKGYSTAFSAVYKNPYREWIGAQIRGDYYGYINPCDIETAAEMAWRDASISHVKNGIYGEMFVSAMLASCYVYNNIKDVINAGLSVIPQHSRLFERISNVRAFYEKGNSYYDFLSDLKKRYNEWEGYDWCHTISNAEIVAAALLYGNDDYGKSVCMAVEAGFDTDCNGATVGSVMGLKKGFKNIGEKWHKPVNGKLDTTIIGMGRLEIEDLISKTISHIKKYGKEVV